MDNPFKKVGQPPEPLPKELKKKVMNDVAIVQLLMETTSLFTVNYVNAIESIFKNKNKIN